jgi:ketosteroid isomerase-like protein
MAVFMAKVHCILFLSFFLLTTTLCAQAQQHAVQTDPAAAEVLAAENARTAALLHKDLAALDKLFADDLTYVHASGRVDTKASFMEALRTDQLHYISWEAKEMHVRVLGDSAVLNGEYHVRVINRQAQPDPLDMNVFILAVYARRDGHWQQITWQSTKDVGATASH